MADVDEKTKKARAERREKLLAWYEEDRKSTRLNSSH